MYFTFQALLLCFFLAQMANGQEDPVGMVPALALKLAEQGTHFPGGSYYNNLFLMAVYRQVVIKNGKSNLLMWTSGKTPTRYLD